MAQTEFLVRKHLLLSHLSQRRDLNDVAMIANLAQELSDEETLRELYLLTVADMSMVAPGNLTEWKEQLLRELYVRTLAHYRRGADLAGTRRRATLVARRKQRVAELLGEPRGGARAVVRVAARSLRHARPRRAQMARAHAAVAAAQGRRSRVEVVHRPRKAVRELTVCADDAPGLLAKIAGVLLANRIDVLGGADHLAPRVGGRRASRRSTSSPRAIATAAPSPTPSAGSAWRRIWRACSAARVTVEALIAERRERSSLPERVVPAGAHRDRGRQRGLAPTSASSTSTRRIGSASSTPSRARSPSCALDIQLSKVATEASRVADVFYVRERGGGKLGAERVDEVRLALGEALGACSAHG